MAGCRKSVKFLPFKNLDTDTISDRISYAEQRGEPYVHVQFEKKTGGTVEIVMSESAFSRLSSSAVNKLLKGMC